MCRLFSLALIALFSAAASAATLGDARVGFTAERILVLDGQRYVGRIWQMPGVQRHEQDLRGLKPVFILRRDSPVGDIVLAQLHAVVEFALPKAFAVLESPGLLRRPIARERVNGIATVEYAVDETAPAGHAVGSLWLSADGIPIKCEGRFTANGGKVTTFRWELRHVRIGRQNPAFFEAPKAFARLPPEAAASLLGLRMGRPHGG